MPIQTIVVPLDGSDYAARALPTAGWLADRMGAGLRLLMTTFDADSSEDEARLREQAATTGRDDVEIDLQHNIFAGAGIVETVDALPGGALCMTTRGRGPLAQALLGSVSDEVLRVSTSPVVLVGPAYEAATSAPELVVCLDDSHGSTALIPVVAEWADQLGLGIHLVSVDPQGVLHGPDDAPGALLLEAAARKLDALAVPCETHVLRSSHPGDALLGFAAARDASLVAVSSQGHGATSAALGSVARHVVRHSPRPVLVRR